MKVELNDDVRTMTTKEVVDALEAADALTLDENERVGWWSLECGCDLEVFVYDALTGEERTEAFTEQDVRDWLCAEADWCAWGHDEDGDDVLVVFAA